MPRSQTLSLVVSQAGHVKPEIRLNQAIAAFESALTEQQRDAFTRDRGHGPPTANSVITLVGELGRRSRSAGLAVGSQRSPRFRRFLSTLRILTGLADLVVGGSQNIIACSVWGVVKTALESICRHGDFFEKLSQLFMTLGRSCPDVEEYIALFPKDDALRDNLLQYAIVTVELSTDILAYINKSKAKRILQSATQSFDSIFGTYGQQLEQLGHQLDRQILVNIAKRQLEERRLQEQDRRENVLARQLLHRFSEERRLERRNKFRARLLQTCAPCDSERLWSKARKWGDAQWFLNHPEYIRWKSSTSLESNGRPCSVHKLQCEGTIGSGKTVIAASVVEDLMALPNSRVAYYFPDRVCLEATSASTISSMLLRQLILNTLNWRSMPDLIINELDTSLDDTLPIRDAYRVYARCYSAQSGRDRQRSPLYLVIDDASLSAELLDIVSCGFIVNDPLPLKIFFTGFCTDSRYLLNSQRININRERPNEAVEEYITAELLRRLSTKELVLTNPDIIVEIRDGLVGKADGM